MSATDLKEILHKQIDRLEDVEDVRDLLLTVNEFVGQRQVALPESPEFLDQLQAALQSAQSGRLTSHDDVINEAKTWLTR